MPFRLPKKTREWFSHIHKEFELDFDMYYLCLMAGLATDRKVALENELEETTELVSHFPGAYREKGRLITSIFLSRELKAMGVQAHERDALNRNIASLVDPQGATLGEPGMKEMNRYVYGGFEVLTEWFDDKPRFIDAFLPAYTQQLQSALEKATGTRS